LPCSATSSFIEFSSIGFFLFGYIKGQVLSLEFDSPVDLLEWIRDEFEKISPAVLEEIFDSWIMCVGKYIQHEGDYVLDML
jgi:hypothetical protein